MVSNGTYLRMLLWKNWIVAKRRYIWFIVEHLLPVLFFLILALIRLDVKTKPQGVYAWGGCDFCTFPDAITLPHRLAFTPNTAEYAQIMTTASQSIGNFKPPVGVNSDSEMVEFLQFINTTVNNTREFLGGVSFVKEGGQTSYSLRFQSTPRNNNNNESPFSSGGWITNLVFPSMQVIGPRQGGRCGGLPSYYREGFVSVQCHVGRALVEHLSGGSLDDTTISGQRMPYPPFIQDDFIVVVTTDLSFILLISFVFVCLLAIKDIASEKEYKLKESMKMMGISSWLHWTSWSICYLISILFITSIITVFSCVSLNPANYPPVLPNSEWSVIFFFYLLYGISSISFAFMVSTFFSTASVATVVGSAAFLTTYVPYMFISQSYNGMALSTKIGWSFVSNVAMSFGTRLIGQFEATGSGVQWSNLNTPVTVDDNLTMLHVFLMMFFDAVLYMVLALYIEAVYPGSFGIPKPFYFPFTKTFWCGESETEIVVEEGELDQSDLMEQEPRGLKPLVQITKLTKRFGNKTAVDRLSMTLYEGQITSLLGHNGAGKTTTMFMLTGFIPPSSGSAVICGHDIQKSTQKVRQCLGLCPQHDILFKDLTVEEHLLFFSIVKGCPKDRLQDEIDRMVDTAGLTEKRHAKAGSLSGGQKRKLSVAMALIGDSKVVIFDEPTSGMDPDARRHTWDILQRNREGRAILLSTHYMEEADVLGDRIAIVADGKLQCLGSSIFLKQKYGEGYRLTLIGEKGADVQKMQQVVRKHVPGCQPGIPLGAEVAFTLPYDGTAHFEALFSELEERKKELSLSSMGMSVTTMEEVFLKAGIIASEDDDVPEVPVKVVTDSKNGKKGLVSSVNGAYAFGGDEGTSNVGANNSESSTLVTTPNLTSGVRLILSQIPALTVKHIYYTIRSPLLAICQFFFPITCAALTVLILKSIPSVGDAPALVLDTSSFKNNEVPYYAMSGFESYSAAYANQSVTHDTVMEKVTGDMQDYLVAQGIKDLSNYTHHTLVGASFSGVNFSEFQRTNAVAWYNNEAYHAAAISMNTLLNGLLQFLAPGTNMNIVSVNHPLPVTGTDKEKNMALYEAQGLIIAWNMVWAMGFLASSCVLFIVQEATSKAKHVQFVSGVNGFSFWFSTFIWHYIIFIGPIIICVLIFIAAGVEAYALDFRWLYMMLAMFTFAWGCLPQMYLLSLLFTVPARALLWTFMWNLVAGLITLLAVNILSLPILNLVSLSKVLDWLFSSLLPQYCLGQSLLQFYINWLTIDICDTPANQAFCPYTGTINPCCHECIGTNVTQCFPWTSDYMSWEVPGIGRFVFFMLIHGLLYSALLALVEMRLLRRVVYKLRRTTKLAAPVPDLDPDVSEEEARVERLLRDAPNTLNQYGLVFSELSKVYNRDITAVNRLSVAVPRGECFGLLGMNGAGKTSTLKMITGDEYITGGDGYIVGNSVKNAITKARAQLGYCPQFDGLVEHMTGRQLLHMFAVCRGVPSDDRRIVVEDLIHTLTLNKYADRMTSTYSGGNKRKLSTAIALIGDPPIILLDEPSCGMDPGARRHVWDVLTNLTRVGKTVILVSHSMEECEAVCSRLVIMVNGHFRCMGSAAHLKAKFGEGYTLIASIIEVEFVDEFHAFVEEKWPTATLKDSHLTVVQYELSSETTSLSQIFALLEANKEMLHVEDYSVSETSLEQIFLNFAREQAFVPDPVA